MKYPSVTEIIEATKTQDQKDSLKNWKLRVGETEAQRISQEALQRGNRYDKMIIDYILMKDITHLPLKNHLDNFTILSVEQKIKSNKYKYRGRYDCIFKYDDILIINDFKGSSKPKQRNWISDYFVQISAYWNAITEMGGNIHEGMITIILENDIQVFSLNYDEYKYYFNVFIQKLKEFNNLNKPQ